MAEEKKSGNSFSLPGAGAIAIAISLLGALLIGQGAFIDERPNIQDKSDYDSGYAQDVDARLWQDPFSAITKDIEKHSSKTANLVLSNGGTSPFKISIKGELSSVEESEHGSSHIYEKWRGGNKPAITVIAAMVSGGPYSEMHEMRIRHRYALVSALSTLRFKPNDSEHIGYFRPAVSKESKLTKEELPEEIPFEWFDPSEHANNCEDEDNKQTPLCRRVLVLWIDSTRFAEKPITKIREILNQVAPSSNSAAGNALMDYAVIGPNDSGQLRALTKELKGTPTKPPTGSPIKFFAAAATAEDAWIWDGIPKSELPVASKKWGITLTRTIATDGRIAKKLVAELSLRNIDPNKDHVVLLSEWDTLYGRALPLTFATAYRESKTPSLFEQNPSVSYDASSEYENLITDGRVHCFSYERGIDGRLPGNKTKKEAKDNTQPSAGEVLPSPAYDRPDGLSQKDYLRRLAVQIKELDHKLTNPSNCFDPAQRCGISAIGVLGYDVYDKLAILQALKPYFPGKLFFTTELDALYSSPKELPSTHNLLVASSFGLQLRPEIQKNIPPFRDSYQTSFFLTTLLATTGKKGDLDKWLREPRIFEIGRKGPIDLSGEKNYQPCTGYLDDCADIHPQGVWARPRDYVSLLFWICVALGITLLYRISWTFRDIVQRALAPVLQAIRKHSLPKVGAISLAVAILIFVLVWILRTYAPPNQEPWLWTDGISIWPSELLRILALMLCIFFVMLMRKELTQSNIYLEKKYFHKEYSDDLSHDKSPGFARFVSGLKSVHSWKSSAPGDTASVDVENIWKEYREKGSFQVRILRSLPGLITFIAFAYFAVLLSGGLPVPARGDLAFVLDRVIEILSGTSVILLATFVVDASRLGHRFIQHLNGDGKPSLWPSASSYAAKWGLREDCVVYWIDVKCVADLTKTIGNFIWCPIITLLLLVASRSSLFDDYYFSYGLVIAISILLLNLFSCAFWLQSGANDMKDKAIRELDKKLRALRAGYIQNIKDLKVEREIAQLESMIEEIRNIKKGAFTPFLQQPPVMAVLAILSGGSGLPLLERLF